MLNSLASNMLLVVLTISGIPLLACAISGLIISVLQTATSIQEQSITYLVKLSALILSTYLCSNWFLNELLELIRQNISAISFIKV